MSKNKNLVRLPIPFLDTSGYTGPEPKSSAFSLLSLIITFILQQQALPVLTFLPSTPPLSSQFWLFFSSPKSELPLDFCFLQLFFQVPDLLFCIHFLCSSCYAGCMSIKNAEAAQNLWNLSFPSYRNYSQLYSELYFSSVPIL